MYLKLILILSIQILFVSASIAQTWQSLNGPLESDIRDIIIKNDSIYVVSWPNGLFKKALNSNQWLFSGVGNIDGLLSIEIGQEGMYYAGGGGIVTIGDGQAYLHFYKSTNYGNSWNEFRNGIEFSHTVKDILVDINKTLFIGCESGVFKFSEPENKFIRVGNKYGTNIFYSHNDTIISGASIGIEYSTDSGDTWDSSGPDSLKVEAITYGMGKFFFGSDEGLYSSDSLETEWTPITEFESTSIHSLFSYNNQVLVGTDSGAYLLDENLSMQPIFPELSNQKIQVINAQNETFFIGTNKGLYNCSLENSTCELDGVPNSKILSLATQNDTLLINSTREVYRYFTTEQRWDTTSISVNLRRILPHRKDSIYAIENRRFYKCSFTTQQCSDTRVTEPGEALLNFATTTDKIFTFSSRRVYQSNDNADSWNTILEDSPRTFHGLSVFKDSLLFISGATNLKYTIGAQSFDTLSKSVALVTENGTLYSATDGIHKSTNFGETWSKILSSSDYLPDGFIREILFDENTEKLYVVTTVGRVYVTENGGLDWGVNEEMYPIYIESTTLGTDGTLYLGTGKAGVFVNNQPLNPPITISNEEELNTQPRSFRIFPNYPNPFNPSTTISFQLNSAQRINLDVLNILGQKIGSYDLGLRQAGTQKFILNLSNQASGVYVIRISSGSEIRSAKVTLIK
ncbi:MAG: T9SS type A sorting domain-containing protein [Balneola sp.]